ncbi:Pro-Pol polyprotein, partial [Tetrabaena socialis]
MAAAGAAATGAGAPGAASGSPAAPGGAPPHRVLRRAAHYHWLGAQLQRRMPNGHVRVCPSPGERPGLALAVHEATGHLGTHRTLALLQTGHWWYGMRRTVQPALRQCRACDLSNTRGAALPAQLHPLPVRGLFYRLGVDLAGPFTLSAVGNTYCMVVIEHFSKHVELLPLPDKTAACTARAFADVLARFGAPAEVLTDNGREFEGEFAEQLERCFIGHRHTSPGHPQADGAAERVVQVLKDVLRKACYEAAEASAWELAIPDLLLGYRCSPQKSTRYSPYELLYGGITPIIPPAVRERLLEPIDFEDPAAALVSVQQRASWDKGTRPGGVPHTLRYSAIRTGRYLAKPTTFAPGDYVYVRRGNVTDTLQFSQHDIVLRVETVGLLGVAVLLGRDGARMRRRVEQLRPCHLDIDPALSPHLFRPQRDLQCELCGSPHQAAKMLLCDGCNTGWHTHCLRLSGVPVGQWLCPRCVELDSEAAAGAAAPSLQAAAQAAAAAVIVPVPALRSSSAAGRAALSAVAAPRRQRRQAAAVAGRNEELGRLLFPQAATRRRDEAAAALQGRRVLRVSAGVRGAAAARQSGVLEYLGALARPRYFVARWDDGTEEELTLARAQVLLAEEVGGV